MAYKEANDYYCNEMNEFCGGDKPYVPKEALKLKHIQTYKMAKSLFEKFKKMGNREFHDQYILKLEETLLQRHQEFVENNEAKNILKTFRFAILIFIIFIVCLILSETFELIGLQSFNFPFVFCGRMCFILILTWAYLKSTGRGRDIMLVMNQIADLVWEIGQQTFYDHVFPCPTIKSNNNLKIE